MVQNTNPAAANPQREDRKQEEDKKQEDSMESKKASIKEPGAIRKSETENKINGEMPERMQPERKIT